MKRSVARYLLAFLVLLLCAAPAPCRAAETVAVRAAEHDSEGFGRIALDWPAPVTYEARVENGRLILHFARPFTAKLDAILRHLDGYVATASISEDGTSIIAQLKKPATVKTFVERNTVAVDIIVDRPAGDHPVPSQPVEKPVKAAAATKAPAPAKTGTAEPAAVPIRHAAHEGFRRIVFDWSVPTRYTLSHDGNTARLRFDRPAKLDAALLNQALAGLDPVLSEEAGATIVALTVPAGTKFRHFHSGNSIVLDVLGGAATMPSAPTVLSPPAAKAATVLPPPELIEPTAAAPEEEKKPPVGRPRPLTRPSAAAPPAGALPVHFALAPQGASLRFDWPTPTAAAVFRRGAATWIVFAGAKPLDLSEPEKLGGDVLSAIDQLPDSHATVLRLIAREELNPTIRRADASWIIDLKPQPLRAETPVAVDARPSAAPPSVFFPIDAAAETLYLRDTDVGDTLAVVPTGMAGAGIDAAYDFVDFRALASAQGLVFEPHADDLRLTRGDDGITVSRPGGLVLSTESDRQLGRVAEGSQRRFFDLAGWGGARDQSFLQKRSRLERAVATAPAAYRSKPRLALARFYFANLYAPEAEGVIDAIRRDDPGLLADPAVLAMSGAVRLLAGDRQSAAQELGQKVLDDEPEATLWRAALAAETGDWPTAAHGFALSSNLLSRYPPRLRDRFALAAAEAFLETDRAEEAAPMLQIVLKGDAPRADRAMALYLDGRRALKQGEYARAIELWNMAAAMDDRPSRARALFARTMAELDTKQISRADAIKALDGMRFAWRGDNFEFDLLQKLGDLKIADGDLRGGFDVLREAADAFPDNPASKEVMKRLSDGFAEIFLGKRMNEVSPLKALSLYEEFKDYAPVGERGDAMVRRLVDRLVSVDLLDNAAALLDDQVNHRLTGRDKARVAAQLSLLRLLDHKPDAAIAALDIDVGKDLPPELAKQRQQLRARALSELNRDQEALALLASDSSRDADRLRADIFWRAHNWSEAAKIFARLVPAPEPDGKLDKETSQLVLNWASALTLAGNQKGLAELRAAYGKGMAETPLADAFRIVAGDPAQLASGDDPRTVANRVAQVSELQSFMTNFKERLAKDKLSSVN